jgi:nickel-dependent lactate racemase
VAKKLFMVPFSDVNSALKEAFRQTGPNAKIWVMPTGGTTLPQLKIN